METREYPEARCVLYIEDVDSHVKLLDAILQRRPNARLISATTGEEGLRLARDQVPDLVLLDLFLPGMDGTEVLRRLRADESTRDIPVVVFSADPTAAQREALIAAGAARYLSKPTGVRELLGVLDEILGP